eukprot:20126-Heterococcus_DN1.PRE.2
MSAAAGLVEVCYTGAARERKRLDIRSILGADVVLTTYEVLRAKEEPATSAAMQPYHPSSSDAAVVGQVPLLTPVSRLHCIRWRRVVVYDAYKLCGALNKPPTARAAAAASALAAEVRWCAISRDDASRADCSSARLRCLYTYIGVPPDVPMATSVTMLRVAARSLCTVTAVSTLTVTSCRAAVCTAVAAATAAAITIMAFPIELLLTGVRSCVLSTSEQAAQHSNAGAAETRCQHAYYVYCTLVWQSVHAIDLTPHYWLAFYSAVYNRPWALSGPLATQCAIS